MSRSSPLSEYEDLVVKWKTYLSAFLSKSRRLALEVGDRTQFVVYQSDFMDFYGVYGLRVSLLRLIER